MTYLKENKKEVLAIGVFILYFISADLIKAILISLGINVSGLTNLSKQLLSIAINLVFPILLIIIYRKDLFEDIKKIKKNYSKYLEIGITYYIIGLVGMMAFNVILQFVLHLGLAGNEVSVREMIKTSPIYMVLTACIIAPFQEEMVFRKLFRDIFKNKIFFIIFSGLIFGSLHVIGSFTTLPEILFILPYAFLGSIFALIYTKTDNILVTILIHLIHNSVLVFLQLNLM